MKTETIKSVVIIILTLVLGCMLVNRATTPNLEVYKLESDCGQQAISFEKRQSDDLVQWSALQNTFDKVKGVCFAEFMSYSSGPGGIRSYIYDITHNKEIVFLQLTGFSGNADTLRNETDDYARNRAEIFGK